MAELLIDPGIIEAHNRQEAGGLAQDYEALSRSLARRGIDCEALLHKVSALEIAVPSWGVGTGGTRFARFPGPGEPADIFDKLEDCAVIQQLGRATPRVSLHFPWDAVADMATVRARGQELGLGFDAVNSNTFQDQPGQALSYKFGSLSHADAEVRAQAIAHNIDCIRQGAVLGARALTIWLADGSNFAGQSHLARAFERYVESVSAIEAALPDESWRLLLEYKNFEPAFYATVVQDWGSCLLAAQAIGHRARCLVDLGHHAPSTNIELIVARLISAGKLGGFHLNDSRFGDDDLDAGSVDPFRLFLVFNELVDAEQRQAWDEAPALMLDQSHNLTDPIESLMLSADAARRAHAQALLVDRAQLAELQARNDAAMAAETLRRAFRTDVTPLLAEARRRAGGAIEPVGAYRLSGYRKRVAARRPLSTGSGGGIV
jgi:L-rhamnose isomerase/sugar isomerase